MPPADPYPVLRLLQLHLEERGSGGQTRLWLNSAARSALREIIKIKPRPRPAPVGNSEPVITSDENTAAAVPEIFPKAVSGEAAIVSKPESTTENLEESVSSRPAASVFLKAEDPVPQAFTEMETQIKSPEPSSLTVEEKEARLAEVRARAEEGKDARSLGTLREKMVFATGTAAAEIVLVGEAPGSEEEKQGEPFVGPAGQLLTKILKVMGLERGDVYITNICKYRPAMENQGRKNRQPTPLEMASCIEYVREEIHIINPKVIVTLGATAMTGLLGIKSGVTSSRGHFYEFEGIPVMVTLHPSYLLRKEMEGPDIANAEKRKVWEDMLQVMERAEMPISEKQRRFFLPR